jgi:hypothetical protein
VILQGFENESAKEPNGNHEGKKQKTINNGHVLAFFSKQNGR